MPVTVNQFKTDLRNFVTADASVNGLIGTRFFGAQLATLFDPVFPLATFEILQGLDENQSIVERFEANVAGHSNASYDQAHDVYHAIHERLKNQTLTNRALIRYLRTPTEFYDEKSRIYTVIGRISVVRIP